MLPGNKILSSFLMAINGERCFLAFTRSGDDNQDKSGLLEATF